MLMKNRSDSDDDVSSCLPICKRSQRSHDRGKQSQPPHRPIEFWRLASGNHSCDCWLRDWVSFGLHRADWSGPRK